MATHTKEELITNIKEWVRLDNEMRSLKREIDKRKKDKKEITNTLTEIMRENEIDCIDIKDGQLCYKQKNIKKPINQKYLLEILSKYYKGNSSKASEVQEYILDNRKETIREEITRKIDNKQSKPFI